MTLHTSMKIAGLPADGAAGPATGGAAADLFTQLLSTLALPANAAAAGGEAAAVFQAGMVPGAISLTLPSAKSADDEVAVLKDGENEDAPGPEEEALALAGLFAIPVSAPATSVPAAAVGASASAPQEAAAALQTAPLPVVTQAQAQVSASQPFEGAQAPDASADTVQPSAEATVAATPTAIPAEVKAALASLLPKAGANSATVLKGEGGEAPLDAPASESHHPSASPAPASVARPEAVPVPAMVDGLQAMAADAMTDIQASSFDVPAENDVAIEQQLDLATDGEWLDQLAKDISRSAGKEGTLRFRLNPETLGTLKVEVAQTQAGASIRLTADTESARAIIADAQPRLVSEARAQGVRIAETHVDVGTGAHQGSGDARRDQGEASRQPFFRTAGGDVREDDQSERTAKSASDRYA